MTVRKTPSGIALSGTQSMTTTHVRQSSSSDGGHAELLRARPDGDREVEVVVEDCELVVNALEQRLLSGSFLRNVVQRSNPLDIAPELVVLGAVCIRQCERHK